MSNCSRSLRARCVLFGFLVGERSLGQGGWHLWIAGKRLEKISEGIDRLGPICFRLDITPAEFEGRFGAQLRGQLGIAQTGIERRGGREIFFFVERFGFEQFRLIAAFALGIVVDELVDLRAQRRIVGVVESDQALIARVLRLIASGIFLDDLLINCPALP